MFANTYKIALREAFVTNTNPKEHGLASHTEGYVTQLRLNTPPLKKQPLKKRQIYVVNYGMNTGSEINGSRPSIIYKDSDNTLGEDVTVIPLTSAMREKLTDKFDLFVPKDDDNKLFQNSYARLRQIRTVSTKRLKKPLGIITSEAVKQKINETIQDMLGTDK